MLRIVGGESVSKYILALVAITKENGGYEQVQDLNIECREASCPGTLR